MFNVLSGGEAFRRGVFYCVGYQSLVWGPDFDFGGYTYRVSADFLSVGGGGGGCVGKVLAVWKRYNKQMAG